MKLKVDALSAKLDGGLGAGSVTSDPAALAAHGVDGKTPKLLCLPAAPEQVAAALRICADAGACVTPWGGGTAMSLGNIPREIDVVIGLERLNKLVEHDDANLTATAEAGITVGSFQENLRRQAQFLPADPAHPSRATIGGMVAANSNGPRRMAYGGVRDLVIGMKMVLATGDRIKAGGKVVKNVAGYDLCKLFVGSLGTLGIITELTFRVAPLPESTASFLISGSLDQCMLFVDKLSLSQLLPAAVTVLNSEAAKVLRHGGQSHSVLTWLEGFEEAVGRHLRDLRQIASESGLDSEPISGETHQHLWEQIESFGMNGEGVLYRVTIPPGSAAEVLATIESWSRSGETTRCVCYPGTATVWVLLDAAPSSIQRFSKLTALAGKHRGHAAIAAAPPELKKAVDVWGKTPESLPLMREIKRQFDPQGILNPGRFLAYL